MTNFYVDGLFVDNLRKASERLVAASHEKADLQSLTSALDNLSKAVPVSVDNGQTLCDYREMAQALCREPSSFLVKGPGSSDYPKWLHNDLAHIRELIRNSMSVVQQVVADINKIVTLPLSGFTPLLQANLRGISQRLSDLVMSYQINNLSSASSMPVPPNSYNPAYPAPFGYPQNPYLIPPHDRHYGLPSIPTLLPEPTEPVPHFPPVELPKHRIPTVFAPRDENDSPPTIPGTGFLRIPDMQAPFDPGLKQIADALIPTGPLSRHME